MLYVETIQYTIAGLHTGSNSYHPPSASSSVNWDTIDIFNQTEIKLLSYYKNHSTNNRPSNIGSLMHANSTLT